MEFAKLRQTCSLFPEADDKTRPRIGKVVVSDDFHGSDGNFYPNHEVFGVCRKGEYPLYGQFEFRRDETHSRPIEPLYMHSAIAHIPGVSYDGKTRFEYPFHIYGYEVGEYLGGRKLKDVSFSIVLDEPFRFDEGEKGVVGYDMAWMGGDTR